MQQLHWLAKTNKAKLLQLLSHCVVLYTITNDEELTIVDNLLAIVWCLRSSIDIHDICFFGVEAFQISELTPYHICFIITYGFAWDMHTCIVIIER